jgi:hypothetical protein
VIVPAALMSLTSAAKLICPYALSAKPSAFIGTQRTFSINKICLTTHQRLLICDLFQSIIKFRRTEGVDKRPRYTS